MVGKKQNKQQETEDEVEESAEALTHKQVIILEKERLQKELDLLNEIESEKEFMKTADKRITYVEEMVKLNREYLLEHNKMIKSLEEVCQVLIKEEK